MAAHRYWRFRVPTSYGAGNIEIGEFHLLTTVGRVDASATLTSSVAPVVGSLSSLQDDDLDTLAEFSPGVVFTWDLGVGVSEDITDVRIAAGDSESKFPNWVEGDYSDDGTTWVAEPLLLFIAPLWPGVRTKTQSSHPTGYRLTISPNGSQLGIHELELKATVGGASFSSSYQRVLTNTEGVGSPGFVATHAFDGLTTTGSEWRGSGSGAPAFIEAQFATPQVLAEISIWKQNTGQAPVDFYLSGFRNQREVILGTWTGQGTWVANVPKTFAVSSISQMLCRGLSLKPQSFSVISNGGHEPPYAGSAKGLFVGRLRPDYNYDPNARGRTVGNVARDADPSNIPLRRRVRLYRDRDGMFIREVWSNAAGDYQFDYIEEWEAYTVIAHDHEFLYRAVVADNLTLANGGVELIP